MANTITMPEPEIKRFIVHRHYSHTSPIQLRGHLTGIRTRPKRSAHEPNR